MKTAIEDGQDDINNAINDVDLVRVWQKEWYQKIKPSRVGKLSVIEEIGKTKETVTKSQSQSPAK